MGNCEYIREYYDVPACIGRRVRYTNREGVVREGIIAKDRGNYIGVNFDDEKPGVISNFHPQTEGLEYLGMGKVRKLTRSQRRYREYLDSGYEEGFANWLGIVAC